MNSSSRLVRAHSLPQVADIAVRSTLAPPRATLLLCGLVMALINGGLTALMALVSEGLTTTAGSMIALGSMVLWLPVSIGLTALVIIVLAVHATFREVSGVELGFWGAIAYVFRPRVVATLILMFGAILIASVFLIVPGLIVSALLALVIPVMVSERLYLIEALMRSASLVWSNPEGRIVKSPLLRVLAVFALVIALSTLMTLVLQLPLQLITQGMVFREALSGVEPSGTTFATINWISLPFSVVSAIVSVGVYSYFFHVLALYYRDLAERREARHLRSEIHRLERAATQGAAGEPQPFGAGT